MAHDSNAVHKHVAHSDRQLMRLLERCTVDDRLGIENDDVRVHAFAQDTPLLNPQAGCHGG
jgi:hypothetical protein